ncbi:MAG: hypothetical protein ACM3N5_05675 [Candidatus Eiseniibacteriota bacterium]
MTRDELIAKLHDARALVYQAYEATDLPQIQMILRHADQNLHWALWNLGVINSLRPDLPEDAPMLPTTVKKRTRKKPRAKAKASASASTKRRKSGKRKTRASTRGRTRRR